MIFLSLAPFLGAGEANRFITAKLAEGRGQSVEKRPCAGAGESH
jgi:hypothetical protein